jgi:hypothetical protein
MIGRILESKSAQKPCPEPKEVDLRPNSKGDENSIKIQKRCHDVHEIFKGYAQYFSARAITNATERVSSRFLEPIGAKSDDATS